MSSSAFAVPPQLVNFRAPRRAFVLHNARPKPKEIKYVGNRMTVPPIHEIGLHSDTDADGDPIPGTYVVEDIYVPVPEFADEMLVFDAARAVSHILGLVPGSDGTAAVAAGSYALNGLSLLPRHATKEVWKAVAHAGSDRVFLSDVEAARYEILSFDSANAKRKATAMEPMPPTVAYSRAIALLRKYEERIQNQVGADLAPHEADILEDEIELDLIVKRKAEELAAKYAGDDAEKKVELLKTLLEDPRVRALAQKQYRIRKRGHQEASAEQIRAAAETGSAIE